MTKDESKEPSEPVAPAVLMVSELVTYGIPVDNELLQEFVAEQGISLDVADDETVLGMLTEFLNEHPLLASEGVMDSRVYDVVWVPGPPARLIRAAIEEAKG